MEHLDCKHTKGNFYPRSPCGERPSTPRAKSARRTFLSTLSLRRATIIFCKLLDRLVNFYPRSPCGERPAYGYIWPAYLHFYPRSPCGERLAPQVVRVVLVKFLSTLSLRRATLLYHLCPVDYQHFYPRSPCGERPYGRINDISRLMISIHALLAESDSVAQAANASTLISIHALLAESDDDRQERACEAINFYPRSPCGERLTEMRLALDDIKISIHALLAESDWGKQLGAPHAKYFYPRSPCGERPNQIEADRRNLAFLSTLSLRRATGNFDELFANVKFLSTLSLRRATHCILFWQWGCRISIHALLAESDATLLTGTDNYTISIHALLAESDAILLPMSC